MSPAKTDDGMREPCNCTRHVHCPLCNGIQIEARSKGSWCLECGYQWTTELAGPAGGAPAAVDERSTDRATAESTGIDRRAIEQMIAKWTEYQLHSNRQAARLGIRQVDAAMRDAEAATLSVCIADLKALLDPPGTPGGGEDK